MTRITSLAAACAILAALTACGGGSSSGSGDNPAASNPPAANMPTVLKTTDTVAGTGTLAAAGDRVQVNYTGWLYDAKATDSKGTRFDASAAGTPLTFVIGATGTSESVITGFSQGVQGMKVGGKRTVVIPAALAYGSSGAYNGNVVVIPPNTAVVFDIELVKDCGAKAC